MRLDEIEAEQEVIRSKLKQMEDDGEVTEEGDGDLRDTLIGRYKLLDAKKAPIVKTMEDLDLIKRAGQVEGNRETGTARYDVVSRTRRDPFANLDEVRERMVSRSEIVGRALDGIELNAKRQTMEHDHAEIATRRVQTDPGIARHVLLTGSDDYQRAFAHYMETGDNGFASRSLSLGTGSAGFMLPFVLDPTIILSNNSSANPWRRMSRVVQTTSNTWNGVSSAGVNAGFLAEGAAASDASPTMGQVQITPAKAAAWVFGSYESLGDTNFADQLPALFADAKDRLEEQAFATGGGGTGAPQGVVTGLGTGQRVTALSTATTGVGVSAAVYALMNGLGARFRASARCGWAGHLSYINAIRAVDTAGGSSFWANFGMDQPEQLLGKAIYESTTMLSTSSTATGSGTGSATLVFGDFNEFIIADRVGASVLYEPMVTSQSTANTGLPSGQSGWFLFWRVGSQVAVPNAFRYTTNG